MHQTRLTLADGNPEETTDPEMTPIKINDKFKDTIGNDLKLAPEKKAFKPPNPSEVAEHHWKDFGGKPPPLTHARRKEADAQMKKWRAECKKRSGWTDARAEGIVDFQFADLKDAPMCGVKLGRALFHEAHARNIRCNWSVLFQANLCKAFFRGAHLKGTELKEVQAQGCNLVNANVEALGGETTNFEKAHLEGSDLEGMGMPADGAEFKGASFKQLVVPPARRPPPTKAPMAVFWAKLVCGEVKEGMKEAAEDRIEDATDGDSIEEDLLNKVSSFIIRGGFRGYLDMWKFAFHTKPMLLVKALDEITFVLERLKIIEEKDFTSETCMDAAESWIALLRLRSRLKAKCPLAILDAIVDDKDGNNVLLALGMADALRSAQFAKPPAYLVKLLKEGPGSHMKRHSYTYRRMLEVEQARIGRIQVLQQRTVATVGALILSWTIALANIITQALYDYIMSSPE